MSTVVTSKLDELFRKLPKNSGLDPRLIDAAKTELNFLKFKAGVHVQAPKQKTWSKTEVDQLQEQMQDRDMEIMLLKRQLMERTKYPTDSSIVSRRPNQIKDLYMRLYDHDWVTVYEYLKQHSWTEIEIVITLQRILRASYSFCKDVAMEQLENIEGEALYPTATWMDDDCIVARMRQKEISREISELAKLYQRTTAQECLSALQKTFIESVLPTFIDPSKYSHKCVTSYTSVCVDLTWSMSVQDPPMVFIDKLERGADFNSDSFRKFSQSGGDKFDYLVWPAMRLYSGGPLVIKGIAEPIKLARDNTPVDVLSTHRTNKSLHDTVNTPPHVQTPARGTDVPEPRSPRNPEDWVDLDMQSEDNNPFDSRDTPQTPTKVYKREPGSNREAKQPKSPYFTPFSSRTPKGGKKIPKIKVEQSDDGARGRYSRSEDGGVSHSSYKPGNLTVMWKNMDSPRDRRSAP